MAPEQMEAAEYLPDVTYERATNGKITSTGDQADLCQTAGILCDEFIATNTEQHGSRKSYCKTLYCGQRMRVLS
jgi:hypothetical protein